MKKIQTKTGKKGLSMVKKGFSMVELLFVMAVMAALAAIAIPSMSASTDSAKLTSMRSDVQNMIMLMQTKYIDTQDFSQVLSATTDFIDEDDNGLATNTLDDSTPVPISKGNSMTVSPITCDSGASGFIIDISNDTIPNTIEYDSCNSGKITELP